MDLVTDLDTGHRAAKSLAALLGGAGKSLAAPPTPSLNNSGKVWAEEWPWPVAVTNRLPPTKAVLLPSAYINVVPKADGRERRESGFGANRKVC